MVRAVALGSGGAITDHDYILCDMSLVHLNNYQALHWQTMENPLNGFAFEVRAVNSSQSRAIEVV